MNEAEKLAQVLERPGYGWSTTPAQCAALLRRQAEQIKVLLRACENARDIIVIDRQSFVDCQQLRDGRIDDPIAHGLVFIEEDVWLDPDDAEALRDYDRALTMIDAALAATKEET